MDIVPITSLTPSIPPPADRSIRAVVTLSWPYSSSTRQCALLLADPDFRLRHHQGQVRVRFTGPSAEAIARTRVGIGDEVVLALDGASWEQDPEATRTPGRSVDGELLFKRRLQFTVVKAKGNVDVHVDAPASPPRLPEMDVDIATPLPRAVQNLRPTLRDTSEILPGFTYTSPAFIKRLRLSGGTVVDSTYDPFSEAIENAKQPKQQNWLSFGGNITWRYAEKTPSPDKDTFDQDIIDVSEQQTAEETPQTPSRRRKSMTRMSPPSLPAIRSPSTTFATNVNVEGPTDLEGAKGPSTPHLRPIGSATLPLPSPFPDEAQPFPFDQADFVPASSDERQNDESHLLGSLQESSQSQAPNRENEQRDQSLLHKNLSVQDPLSTDWTEGTAPLGMLEPEVELGKEGQASVVASQTAQTESQERNEISETSQEHSLHGTEATDVVPKSPRTPIARISDASLFGLDGVTSISPSIRVIPQSEKEKIMTQTYASLFGFRTSPEASSPVLQEAPESPTPTYTPYAASQLTSDAAKGYLPGTQEAASVPYNAPSSTGETRIEEQGDAQHLDPVLRTAPMPSSEIEVIELDSSSDEEERSPPAQMLSLPLPQRDAPQSRTVEALVETIDIGGLPQTLPEIQETMPLIEPQVSQSEEGVVDFLQERPIDESLHSEVVELSSSSQVATGDVAGEEAPATVIAAGEIVEPEVKLDSQEQSQEHFSLPQHSVAESSLYPSLPITPSNSQTITDTISHEAADSLMLDTNATILPPTPQLTQDISLTKLQDTAQSQASIAEEELQQSFIQESETVDGVQMPLAKKTPARKSQGRLSNVPDIISDWFSPKRSTAVTSEETTNNEVDDQTNAVNVEMPNDPTNTQQVNGLSTSLAYFTPLSKLEELLNPSSQQTYGTNIIDVFAVVADHTSKPVRATTGPRDYFTIFKISEASLLGNAKVRVEVYRPWHATLPVASIGDVILLRGFAVKSRKHNTYLLSTDASAWCVWRFSEKASAAEDRNKPIWARRRGSYSKSLKVEMKGPPLELGDEESDHAIGLHEWWCSSHKGREEYHEDNGASIPAPPAHPVVAKF